MKALLIISICLTVWAAGCYRGGNTDTVHPTRENLTSGIDHVLNVETQAADSIGQQGTELISMLEGMQESVTIGLKENEIMGLIQDVVFDSYNRIYILDRLQQTIGVFNSDGVFLATLGGKGQGPGEFEFASSITIFNDDLLLVANGERFETFEIREDSIEFLETVQLDRQSQSLCTAGDMLFVHSLPVAGQAETSEHGNDTAPMFHAYALPSFEHLFSFGHSYMDDHPFVVNRMSTGDLSCNEVSSMILFTFEMMPVIHGYSAENGALKWKTRIDGLSMTDVTETTTSGGTGVHYSMPEGTVVDRLHPPVSMMSKYVMFQVERRILPEPGSFESHRMLLTYLLNSTTGEGVRLNGEYPLVANASSGLIASPSERYTACTIYTY